MKTLLVPVDFSETSERALVQAIDLADRIEAKIHLLHVIPLPLGDLPDALIARSQAALDRVAQTHRGSGRIAGCWLRHGDERSVILDAASELAIDIIVIGGGVADSLLAGAACPVLLVSGQKGASS